MATTPSEGAGAGSVLGNLGAHPHMATTADDAAAEGPVPLLVRVLAGNPVTGATIFACLDAADARHLRQLHPAVASVVVRVPWCDTDTPVVDAVRWRAAFPAGVGTRLAPSAGGRNWLMSEPAVAALGGITHLDLQECEYVTDKLLLHLPTSLCVLSVRQCEELTWRASFAHLPALVSLDCSMTWVVSERTDGLAPSLLELDITGVGRLRPGTSMAHLSQLLVLRADQSGLGDATLASLPPSLQELHAAHCHQLTTESSFAHLTALRMLGVAASGIGDTTLASMPPCLVSLNVRLCKYLTPAAVLPHLPALQTANVSGTGVGDALVASLPASLVELRMVGCLAVTTGATLDHVRALRLLHCIDTEIAPAALAACRARGCAVPAASVLRGHAADILSLVLLGDGRLASHDSEGVVKLWNVATAKVATVPRWGRNQVRAVVALRDGRHLAIGTASWDGGRGDVDVWSADGGRHARRATIDCLSGVRALVALADDRLAAGCIDGAVRVVGVDARDVVVTLKGHRKMVTALAVLPDGTLASGSRDTNVRLWDVTTQACVATLAGHVSEVRSLGVLADGRLASGACNGTVRLWDVRTRACVGVLPGDTSDVAVLAALPDGRLATGSDDGTIRMWDTRPAAAAGASRAVGAVGAVPVEVVAVLADRVRTLLSLPDGRLACGDGAGLLYLLELPPAAACRM